MGKWITWTNELALGIDEIDEQHKVLVEILNDVYEAVNSGTKDEKRLKKIVDGMLRYVNFHFVTEEMKMIKTNYGDYKTHKAQHDSFVEKAMEFQAAFREGSQTLPEEMMSFLKDWLINHIQGTDRQYVPYFNRKD
ncbi:MAG: bacteriohemerythrin [Spirochaetia bacterium]|nr:bacteriohemerythrin [Spirochaetia bacterium]